VKPYIILPTAEEKVTADFKLLLLDDTRNGYLTKIKKMAEKSKYEPSPQIVFDGNELADISKKSMLTNLINNPSLHPKTQQDTAFLGEPIAIKAPTAAYFSRQNGDNLLVIGRNDEMAASLFSISLISLATQYTQQNSQFYFLNYSRADASYSGTIDSFRNILPYSLNIGRRQELERFISIVSSELHNRVNDSGDHGEVQLPIYLFIFGLQYAKDLEEEDQYSYSPKSDETSKINVPKEFKSILREDPDVGIHTFVWCDTYANLTRILDRRSLEEFGKRVVFQMSSEDSSNLIDIPAASKLGQNRAYFFNEIEGQLEKFRPYGLPTNEWLAWVGDRFREKERDATV
jgi:hypothetical protein